MWAISRAWSQAPKSHALEDSVQCGGSSLYSSNNEYNITLVTDTHSFYQNRHQKLLPWRACAASNHIPHTSTTCVQKNLFLLEYLYFTPQIAGAPDLRSSVSFMYVLGVRMLCCSIWTSPSTVYFIKVTWIVRLCRGMLSVRGVNISFMTGCGGHVHTIIRSPCVIYVCTRCVEALL